MVPMPPTGQPLRKLGFLTIGLFDEADQPTKSGGGYVSYSGWW
jgi:hypothetical protein